MLNIIADISFSIIIAACVFYIIKLRISRARIAETVVKTSLEYIIVKGELEKALIAKEEKNLEQTDGFLKFVSDSRDWAYEYIEEVQAGLKKFTDEVGPILKYSQTYGQASDSPHLELLNKISEAYKDLETLLPKDK